MIFEPVHITLKNGSRAVLRSPTEDDAAALLEQMIRISEETEFTANYPEEWTFGADAERTWIRHMRESSQMLSIVCEVDGILAGNCSFTRMNTIKTRHRATMGICVLQRFWGLGIASAMMTVLLASARQTGIAQMELEFVADNERARRLYDRFGFETVGILPNAFRMKDGSVHSAEIMRKQL